MDLKWIPKKFLENALLLVVLSIFTYVNASSAGSLPDMLYIFLSLLLQAFIIYYGILVACNSEKGLARFKVDFIELKRQPLEFALIALILGFSLLVMVWVLALILFLAFKTALFVLVLQLFSIQVLTLTMYAFAVNGDSFVRAMTNMTIYYQKHFRMLAIALGLAIAYLFAADFLCNFFIITGVLRALIIYISYSITIVFSAIVLKKENYS